MKVEFLECLKNSGYEDALYEILRAIDQEFLPPLSARESTVDVIFNEVNNLGSIDLYFHSINEQKTLLVISEGVLSGFLSFRTNCTIPKLRTPVGAYVSTIGVIESARGQGLAELLYRRLISHVRQEPALKQAIATRTWSSNFSHLRLLDKLGFGEEYRIPNDRGDNIDTVVYQKHLFPVEYTML